MVGELCFRKRMLLECVCSVSRGLCSPARPRRWVWVNGGLEDSAREEDTVLHQKLERIGRKKMLNSLECFVVYLVLVLRTEPRGQTRTPH